MAAALAGLLLLSVQPLLVGVALPVTGGAAATWTGLYLFFQVSVLLGYGLAALAERWPLRWVGAAYAALILTTLLWLPLSGGSASSSPSVAILLGWLVNAIGLPAVLLATTSPMLHIWAARAGKTPFSIYAWSNGGSLVGLICTPWLLEWVPISRLLCGWTFLYTALVALLLGLAVVHCNTPPKQLNGARTWRPRRTWIALPLAASLLMMIVTDRVTVRFSGLPVVGVMPLAVYFLSFVVAFRGWRFRPRTCFVVGALLMVATPLLVHNRILTTLSDVVGLAMMVLGLHQLLFQSRPAPERAALFYVWLAFGGALGGVAAAWVAPTIFTTYLEVPITLGFAALVMPMRAVRRASFAALLVVGSLGHPLVLPSRHSLAVRRSWFSVAEVIERGLGYRLTTGQIPQGFQGADPATRLEPQRYYKNLFLAADILRVLPRTSRVAAIGMASGALACFGQRGQQVVFFEIDAAVAELATNERYFTYLRDCPMEVESIQIMDGRAGVRADTGRFDLVLLDAWQGFSVPLHLFTQEAIEEYRRRLRPGGLIALHLGSRIFDLEAAVVNGLAEDGLSAIVFRPPALGAGGSPSWVVVAGDDRGRDRLTALLRSPDWRRVESRRDDRPALRDDLHPMSRYLRSAWFRSSKWRPRFRTDWRD